MNRDFPGSRRGIGKGGYPWRRCWLPTLLLWSMALGWSAGVPGQEIPEALEAPELPADEQADPTAMPENVLGYQFKFDEFEAQTGDKALLGSREWTDLTEVDVILDESRREDIREVLRKAREEQDLHFMVITVKAESIRDYLQITAALLRDSLALEEGGVIVCTDAPATQITAYTTLLETRLGPSALRAVDKQALAASTLAVGVNERSLTLIRTVTEQIASRKASLEKGSLSSAEKLFAPSVDVILTSEQEAARGRNTAETPAPPATGSGSETEGAPSATRPQNQAASSATVPVARTGAAGQPPGFLGAFLAGMGALLVLIAAGMLTRLAVGSIRQSRRRAKNTGSEVVAIREEPRKDSSTAVTAKEGEAAGTAAKGSGAIKPRAMEKRRGKRNPESGNAVREDIREWVENLEKLSDAHRPSGAREYYNPDIELNPLAMGEIHSHYRALFRMLPPTSRSALSESLESLLEEVKKPSSNGAGKEY